MMDDPMPREDVKLPPPVGYIRREDAEAAVALVVEGAAENREQLDIWAQEILEGLAFADVLKITSYEDKIEAHDMVGRGLVEVIRALAPDAGIKALAELRARERESAMQALSSMGQAQEAYEAQLKAEADNAALRARLAEMEGKAGALVEAGEKHLEALTEYFKRMGSGTNGALAAANSLEAEREFRSRLAAFRGDATGGEVG